MPGYPRLFEDKVAMRSRGLFVYHSQQATRAAAFSASGRIDFGGFAALPRGLLEITALQLNNLVTLIWER
jgi:hypothetical protein